MHPESTGGVNRRALLQMVAGMATGAAVVGGISAVAAAQNGLMAQMEMSKEGKMSQPRGEQLYIQTKEIRNTIVHYRWSKSGTLTEVERVPTGGAGSGTVKPISGQESAPNAFEGAGSVILSAAVTHLSAFPFCRERVL